MQVVRVSGTIKKAEEEAIRRARISIRRAQSASRKAESGAADNFMTGVQAFHNDDPGDDDVDMAFAAGIEDPDEPGSLEDESD